MEPIDDETDADFGAGGEDLGMSTGDRRLVGGGAPWQFPAPLAALKDNEEKTLYPQDIYVALGKATAFDVALMYEKAPWKYEAMPLD